MKNHAGRSAPLLAVTTIALCFGSPGASAQSLGKSGYWVDTGQTVWRSGTGLCWRSGYWTPAHAIMECDPDLLPKPVAAATPAPPPPPLVQAPAPAPARGPAPMLQKVTLSADTLFDFDKSVIKPDGKSKLDDLSSKMRGINLEVVIAIGHADSIGSDAYNQRLSVRRAESVKAYLVSKGVEPNRIYTEGKGEKQPIADNKTRDGRAKNRRVEIEVIGTRK